MSDLQFIEATLEKTARRRRWERAFRGLWQGLMAGAIIWLLAVSLYKVLPVPYWSLGAAAGVAGLAIAIGLAWGGWRRNSVNDTARWVDGRQKLQERLSTALEVARSGGNEAWRELIITDAVTHAKELDPRGMIQFRLPKASQWALLLLVLAAGLAFVPEYRTKTFRQKAADQKIIKETGRQLAELTKRSLAARPPALETTQKSMEAVGDLGTQMTKASLTRSEALKDLAKMQEKLKDDLRELGKDPALQRMQQAARATGGETSPDAARLQKQIEAAQKQLGTPTGTPDQMDKMEKDLKNLQQAAKAAMDKSGGMTEGDKQKMSQALSALAKQAQEMGMQIPQLDQAIEALSANQAGLFLKDIDQATTDLEKTKDMAKSLAQMQQQMEKLGKNLAEQLKNGQPEAAQATLQKMIKELKSANLTPEQMQKLMAECKSAISPAGDYGKVAEHLKNAASAMKDGDKPGGAQSLAEASKELEKLMQQMQDGQELLSELQALNQASECVGTCQGWGTCNKPGIGSKPSNHPGSGVGTWSDDSGEYNGPMTERWDNTGINRPDREAKGIADRGDAKLNSALTPDKVKGQFSPGGQMPSITLKGVSIKGQSRVAYEESAVAAQADAQSALSQEKVPRAYQGAVRDYFDDLKKP